MDIQVTSFGYQSITKATKKKTKVKAVSMLRLEINLNKNTQVKKYQESW